MEAYCSVYLFPALSHHPSPLIAVIVLCSHPLASALAIIKTLIYKPVAKSWSVFLSLPPPVLKQDWWGDSCGYAERQKAKGRVTVRI